MPCPISRATTPPALLKTKYAALLQAVWSQLPLDIRAEQSDQRVSPRLSSKPADTKTPASVTREVCRGKVLANDEGKEEQLQGAVAEGSWKQRTLQAGTLPRKSSERWGAHLAALRAFVEENGGRQPSRSSACVEERKLGAWCDRQLLVRRGTSKGALSATQERQLGHVRDWRWDPREEAAAAAAEGLWKQRKLHADKLTLGSSERWEANLAALQAFVGENGGRYPSRDRSSACAEEQKLADWRRNQQRQMRGTGGKGFLSAAQARKLQQLRGWTSGAK